MSDTDSEQEGSKYVTTEMMFIVERVQTFLEILEKSQIHPMKKKKTVELTEIVREYTTLFGKGCKLKISRKK